MKKITYGQVLLIAIGCFFARLAFAVCPICTIAVGAGVGLSRWFGIDDVITGLWVGGLVVSLILWTMVWLDSKRITWRFRNSTLVIGYYGIVVVPLYYSDIVGHPLNRLWGIDKLLLGIVIGSLAFLLSSLLYFYMKKKNNGHAYFPFQKVVMPLVPLLILSVIFYFVTRL